MRTVVHRARNAAGPRVVLLTPFEPAVGRFDRPTHLRMRTVAHRASNAAGPRVVLLTPFEPAVRRFDQPTHLRMRAVAHRACNAAGPKVVLLTPFEPAVGRFDQPTSLILRCERSEPRRTHHPSLLPDGARPAAYRSSRRRILPTLVFGSSVRNSTCLGRL